MKRDIANNLDFIFLFLVLLLVSFFVFWVFVLGIDYWFLFLVFKNLGSTLDPLGIYFGST